MDFFYGSYIARVTLISQTTTHFKNVIIFAQLITRKSKQFRDNLNNTIVIIIIKVKNIVTIKLRFHKRELLGVNFHIKRRVDNNNGGAEDRGEMIIAPLKKEKWGVAL